MNTKQHKLTLGILLISSILTSCSVTSHTKVGRGCMSRFFVGYAKNDKVDYEDDIHNPDNDEYVREVAFNLGIHPSKVTQQQFNVRYGIK